MSGLRIAIVGGGIGGLVLALALREHGLDPDVYEQATELREVGAAVALSANGTRELRRLGMVDVLAANSVVPSSLVVRHGRGGEVVVEHPIGRDDVYERTFGAPFYGVHRMALLRALAAALPAGLHLGHGCVGVTEHAAGVELDLSDGSRVGADLVVGADGVHSVVRSHVAGAAAPVFSGTVGYRGLVPAAEIPSLPDPTPLQYWTGLGRHLLHYPIDGGDTVNFLAVVRVPEWSHEAWMEQCAVEDVVEAFAGWHPAVTEMVGATAVGTRWALHELEPLPRWHTERAVLIGDAAHAMVPHQGQGANQTIEDAVELADCIAQAGGAADLTAALGRYDDRRRRRATAVQTLSRRTADQLHLPDGPESRARDARLANVYADLAWVHSYDARAARAAPATASSAAR